MVGVIGTAIVIVVSCASGRQMKLCAVYSADVWFCDCSRSLREGNLFVFRWR